jgi:hypothetical protein
MQQQKKTGKALLLFMSIFRSVSLNYLCMNAPLNMYTNTHMVTSLLKIILLVLNGVHNGRTMLASSIQACCYPVFCSYCVPYAILLLILKAKAKWFTAYNPASSIGQLPWVDYFAYKFRHIGTLVLRNGHRVNDKIKTCHMCLFSNISYISQYFTSSSSS